MGTHCRQIPTLVRGTNRKIADLQVGDIDEYFANRGAGRWSRVSIANTAAALRGFLRYAAMQGLCADGLAASIGRPRLYQQESLPYAPDWSNVRRMVADADTDRPRDIRDRAILLLLAVYGMRSGEVCSIAPGPDRLARSYDPCLSSEASTASTLSAAPLRR